MVIVCLCRLLSMVIVCPWLLIVVWRLLSMVIVCCCPLLLFVVAHGYCSLSMVIVCCCP